MAAVKGKPRGRPFPKGVSGNPGGRPKSERAYLVERYGEDGKSLHDQLDAILAQDSTPPHVRVDILKYKLDRHSGKAPQSIAVTAPDGELTKTIINNYVAAAPVADASSR